MALDRPLLWLVLYLTLAFLVRVHVDGLQSIRVPDTLGFLNAAELVRFEEILSHHRTFAYPLVLRTIARLGLWMTPVAALQVLAFFAAMPLFWYALKRVSGSAWLAFWAVLPLPFAGVMSLAHQIQPDFLATVATIVAVSFLLLAVAGPARIAWWVGLGGAVFLAYQLRPAAVFLVGFMPVLGMFWRRLDDARRMRWQWSMTLTLTTVLPYVAFCILRLAVVGHFGIVSFGGMNLAGLTANFLDAKLIRELPAADQRLARAMLRSRRQRGWTAMTRESPLLTHFEQYSDNMWDVAIPAARSERRRLARLSPEDAARPRWVDRPARVVENRLLTRAAKAMVARRPGLYLRWIRGAILYGLRQLFEYLWIVGPSLLLLVIVPLIGVRSTAGARAETVPAQTWATLIGLTVLGVGYFATYLGLVCVVSFPFARYFVSMTLFIPSMLTALLFVLTGRLFGHDGPEATPRPM